MNRRAAQYGAAEFYRSRAPPCYAADSLARCYTLLQSTHPRMGGGSLLSKLPIELLRKICLDVREKIDDGKWYHFCADGAVGMINLWFIIQRRHVSQARIVLQHLELPDDGRPDPPLITRLLGHYAGFSGRNMLVRWTHKVEAAGIELSGWPVACTAEELHAPRLAAPPRHRSLAASTHRVAAEDASPTSLTLPRLPHRGHCDATTLELERVSFKKVLIARPDVHHTVVVLTGKPTGQTLCEAEDTLGDAEACFLKVTTGASSVEEERAAEEREDQEAWMMQAMAAIQEQSERLRVEGQIGAAEMDSS